MPERLDVVGKNGIARKESNSIYYATGPNPPNPPEGARPPDPWCMSFEGETRDLTCSLYAHWAAAALDAEVPLTPAASYEDGYNALLLTLAIVESGRSGQTIQLDEFAAAQG